MADSWFVQPTDTRRVTLSDGQWIVLKGRLSIGEVRAMFDRKYEMDPTTREFRLRLAQMGIAEVVAYLVDWSLPDALIRGAGRDVVEAAVGNLLPERFAEIEAAVDAHAAGIETAREAQKKTSSGATTSAPISTSPDVWVGATSG